MYGRMELLAGSEAHAALPDTRAFMDLLGAMSSMEAGGATSDTAAAASEVFSWELAITVARAPGRLDVMGGIADYSGALVLQMPTAEACHVAVQRRPAGPPCDGAASGAADETGDGRSAKRGRMGPCIHTFSLNRTSPKDGSLAIPLEELFPGGRPLPYADAHAYFHRDSNTQWAAYIVGCLLVLATEKGVALDTNESVVLMVKSDVPEGKGVSSSASVEVATMSALCAAYGAHVAGRELALLCQKAENLVVGAPCGVMDQMASALGKEGRLLALLCQPAEVQGCVPLPRGAKVWGIDSGQAHKVSGADYGSVRIGAFMGRRIAGALGAPPRGGYLVNLAPSAFETRVASALPETIAGEEFLEKYGPHGDDVTKVEHGKRYAVRAPTAHPIYEHFRIHAFKQLLLSAPTLPEPTPPEPTHLEPTHPEPMHPEPTLLEPTPLEPTPLEPTPLEPTYPEPTHPDAERLAVLGELMLQSHASYGACGLGSAGTDRLVGLVREEIEGGAHPRALFGAKITGGGSGGTVCVLAAAGGDGDAAVARVVSRYQAWAGAQEPPKVFVGSSMGAVQFGTLCVRARRAG